MKFLPQKWLFLFTLIIFPAIMVTGIVYAADECEDGNLEKCEEEIEKYEERYESTSKQLEEIRNQKNSIEDQISNLSSELSITQSQIDQLQAQINTVSANLEEIREVLADRREKLADKIDLRNKVVRNYSKNGVLNKVELFMTSLPRDGLNSLLPSQDPAVLGANTSVANGQNLSGFQTSAFSYMFKKSMSGEAIKLIEALNAEISTYEKDKAEAEELKADLEDTNQQMVALQVQLENQKVQAEEEAEELEEEEEETEEELKSIQEKIDDLNAKQQQILKDKFGEGYASLGNYESPSWSVPDPPFSPAFGAFSYGAYTHYKGMSQYGAKARAEDGQDYEDIIEFYYNEDVDEKDDFPDKIRVQGYGEMDFQDYLYGLAEMPSSWPMDALRAQAIAARSYAYNVMQGSAYANDGGICTTQSCQVFSKSKSDNPPDRWKEAVDDTKDEVIGGSRSANGYGWYSSTTGGYIDSVGKWDSDGGWPGNAYEKKADSPWFYWAWYSKNYRFDSDTCGRNYPWLTEEEMADILNAWVVWNNGSSSERDRISPVTTSCWGGNPYSMDDMADKADDYGDKYTDISDIDVDIGNNGRTNKITFTTNKGKVTIDGESFKTVFNLRAPSYVAIKSRLYDLQIED